MNGEDRQRTAPAGVRAALGALLVLVLATIVITGYCFAQPIGQDDTNQVGLEASTSSDLVLRLRPAMPRARASA